ncbi:MAG: hypothetical protein sGL2_11100 [Candidatus Mesenet longicola]|nr:MAG: hypothetical protein sGL2_11100 [Candidatus Mesenet longicola]
MKILIASDIFKSGVSRYTYDEAEDLEIIGLLMLKLR